MTDEANSNSEPSGVSPARKQVTTILLLVLVVVLAIELRASLGYRQSGQALKDTAPDGTFTDVTEDQLNELFSMFPSRTQMWTDGNEVEYRYGWFSLLRPLAGRPEAAWYVVFDVQKSMARRYSEEAPEEQEMNRKPPKPGEADGDPMSDDETAMGYGGGGEGGSSPPDGRQRPALEEQPAADDDATEQSDGGNSDEAETPAAQEENPDE